MTKPAPSLTALFAVDEAGGFGLRGGFLPWRCPADLAHFKRTTADAVLIGGSKTTSTLPTLPGRTIITLTTKPLVQHEREESWLRGDWVCASLDAACDVLTLSAFADKRAFLIGGATTLNLAASHPSLREAIITVVDGTHQAHIHLPLKPWLAAAGFDRPPYALLEQPGCKIMYFTK